VRRRPIKVVKPASQTAPGCICLGQTTIAPEQLIALGIEGISSSLITQSFEGESLPVGTQSILNGEFRIPILICLRSHSQF
jgi:hypothetical protein